MDAPGIYVSTRTYLGQLITITRHDTIGEARRDADHRADVLPSGYSAWITTGHPSNRYSAILETMTGRMV